MKKNLIALAVLAASGVASAQSSVTLYGAADVWFGGVTAGGVTNAMVQSGGVDDSFFGIKGTEDLGGGLKANFVLEQAFNIDSGSQADATTGLNTTGQAFSRQSYVGFSSGFGEVRVGKTFTPFDEISGATTPGFDSDLSPSQGVWASNTYEVNPDNTLYYATPSYSGFSGAVSYSLDENKTATKKAGDVGSFNVKYEGGPVYVGLAYQVERTQIPVGPRNEAKFLRLNGSYDLGVVKLLAGYGRVTDGASFANVNNTASFTAGKSTDWELGLNYPVSSALTLSAGYAASKSDEIVGRAGEVKSQGVSLVAHYALSKRTALYGGVHARRVEADRSLAFGWSERKTNIYAVGVRHTF